jgi:[ribosomal protein S18]-alanine N-acetyltransferase
MTRPQQTATRITLRDYAPADFDALHEIDQECFEPAIAYSQRELREYLRLDGAECIIAEADGKIGGFILTAHGGGTGYVVTIDVLPAYRQQSAGTMLLSEAERRLAASGVRKMELETAVDNASAIAFYRKHGYRNQGVIKNYYPNGRDAYSMTKVLP